MYHILKDMYQEVFSVKIYIVSYVKLLQVPSRILVKKTCIKQGNRKIMLTHLLVEFKGYVCLNYKFIF